MVALVAAGAQPVVAQSESAQPTGESPAPASGQLRLGLLLPDLSNNTINGIYNGVQERAAELGGFEILQGGASDSTQWLSACQAIVNGGIDVLAFNTLDPPGTAACVKQADELGIPLIGIFTPIPDLETDTFVTLDYYGNGVKIGEWMVEAVADDPGKIGVFLGAPGEVGGAKDWVQGFEDTVTAGCPTCEIVEVQPNGFSADLGFTAALSMLQANPDMKGLYALFDGLAEGAVEAAQQAGRSDLKIASHNGSCEGLRAILDGTMGYDIYLLGEPFGTWIADAAQTLHSGGTVEEEALAAGWPVTTESAKAILDGTEPDPSGGALTSALEAAQSGC
jgi:ribose transport system substrate-binding protein